MPRQSGTGFVSAQDVARLAGVSRSAVSRTFTPGASVSEETRLRVMRAAESLGYHVNHLARGLISQQTGIVCLVVSDMATPYLSSMTENLIRLLQEAGKVAMVINGTGRLEKIEDAIRQTLNYRAEATVVLSGTPDGAIVKTCLDSGQHLILLNRAELLPGAHNIAVDNARAARTAFGIFLEAGCRRPAVLSSAAGTPSLVERETCFVAAAEEAGFQVRRYREGPTAHASGVAGARRLLSSGEPPDAVFCVTDLLACGFMDAARHEFGLRIPEDVSVIGFDDIQQAGWPSYALTTFAQPVEAIASCVVEAIVDTPAGDGGRRLLFNAPLVSRNTVRPSRAHG